MSTATATSTPQPLWFIDNLAFVHVRGEQTADGYCLVEITGRRGDMPPLHVHHEDDETFYVLEGELAVFAGERELRLGPGECAVAPRGVPHVYRVESEQARWLAVGNGGGFASFVAEVSEAAPSAELPPPGRPADPAALAAAAAARGIEILGPPGTPPGA